MIKEFSGEIPSKLVKFPLFWGNLWCNRENPYKRGKQCSLNTLLPIFGAEILILSITNMAELKSSNLNPY